MPVLPLTDEKGDLADDAPLSLLAVMCFPRSRQRQQEFFAARWARAIISRESPPKDFSLGLEAVTLLAEATPLDQQTKKLRRNFLRGLLVGEILAYICCLYQNNPTSASRSKAQYLQRRNLDAAAREHSSIELPRSERSQQENWDEFSPVAHLWAGLMMISKTPSSDSDSLDLNELRFTHDDIPELLGIAEFFRKIGEDLTPSGQRPTSKSPATTVLNPDETWKCPAELKIPQIETELVFDDDMSRILNTYNYAKLYGLK